ncbi:MAG TPA: hypothetical protein VGM62_01410 [Chthoniobacterales bacterium]|jgi:hypothetical protein
MTDIEVTRALERGEIANESFHHLSHLHVAWVYLNESSSVDEAASKMRRTLQKFAAAAGHAEKYHETITQFWIRLLGHLRDSGEHSDLSEILKAHPWLLEKNASMEYYSRDTLFSDRARISWVDPDLRPLPYEIGSNQCR